MTRRFSGYWDEARATYWFVPSLMVLAAIALSFLTVRIDHVTQAAGGGGIHFLWEGGPDGARSLLEVIAGSMISVATLTFSLTIVTLTLASTQFGPRLLRNFIRDAGNQVVLGTFISTFVYCLLIIRTIRTGVEAGQGVQAQPEFVPYLSVSVGFLLALVSLGVLIYYIHHVSQSIYAPNVIANVAADLMETIDRMFPKEEEPLWVPDPSAEAVHFPEDFQSRGVLVRSTRSGYMQGVDYAHLIAVAARHNLKLAITHRPGHFVIHGDDVAQVWPPETVDAGVQREVLTAFSLGRTRVAPQDVEYAVDQLVEVAVRALSPAINDPFTAMNCIDWLGAALSRLVQKKIPPPYYLDATGEPRILLKHPVTFAGVTEAAFNQIRQNAGEHVAVLIRLLEILAVTAEHTDDPKELAALDRQARMIRSSSKILPEANDRRDVEERFAQVEESQK